MIICHVWPIFFPIDVAGVERYILNLSDFLSKQDENLHFQLLTDKSEISFLKSLTISKKERINSLEVYRLGPNLSSLVVKASYKVLNHKPEVMEDLLTINLYREAVKTPGIDKVDIFHVHGFWQPTFPMVGLMLSQHFHRPLVVTLHGDSVDPNNSYSMPLRSPKTIKVLSSAAVITTYSQDALNTLKELGLVQKSRLIPNFVEGTLFSRPSPRTNDAGTRIVMVSRLSQGKDPITPIRAFALAKKEVPEATLQIVGYGPLYPYIERMILKLNLTGSVTLVGMKSDVRDFLWNNDIYIGTRGSYIATLEAWAAGLAVIAPKAGIMQQVVSDGKNGLLVAPNDIKEYASAMARLMKDRPLRAAIAKDGLETLKNHDIRTIAPSIARIYKSLI